MTPLAKLLKQVQELNKNKKFQEVTDILTPEILATHNSADMYAELAQAHYRLNNMEQYRMAAEQALAIDPNHARGNHYMGNVYADLKEYNRAIGYYVKAIEVDPKYAHPYNGLGIIYRTRGEYEKAIEYYLKAIEADPNYAYPYNNLGIVYRDRMDYNTAIEYYLKAIEADPKLAYPYNGLGNVYRINGNYEKAIEYYLKAIEADPKFAYPYNGLGNVYRDRKCYGKAIEYYLKAIEADPKINHLYYNLGITYFDLEQYQEALTALKHFISLTLSAPDYYTELAKARVAEIKTLLGSKELETIGELVGQIKTLLLFPNAQITHYTGLSAAKALIMGGSPFRLSEGTYLNDTSEGRELFRFLNYGTVETNNNTPVQVFSKKPFIGSFVAPEKHDDLTLWRMYAKEEREEARGCALTINKESLLQAIKDKLVPEDKGPVSGMEDDFSFYRVAYREEGNNRQFVIPGAQESEPELNDLMERLKKAVEDFKGKGNIKEDDSMFVREKLNTIAFLFKTAQYQYEHEVRLVVKEAIGFDKKFAQEAMPPKVYIELVPIGPHLQKITIGPKVARADEWAASFYYHLKDKKWGAEIVISLLPYK